MTEPVWRPTAALARSLVVGVAGLIGAVVEGEPGLLVLAAPFVLAGAMAVARRPRHRPAVDSSLDHRSLREGQGTTSRLLLTQDGDVEQVTRLLTPQRHVLVRPHGGRTSTWHGRGDHALELSPRRWGHVDLAEERVALTSPWCGWRWGPVLRTSSRMRVLPAAAPYRSSGEVPQPHGLVGAHRSVRSGSGTELADIRPFVPGDKLRRINWRVSARSEGLYVTTTRTEEDAGLLLVLDILAEHGVSGGVDGAPSSLDLTVRSAAALAEHAAHRGDRVALRVVGGRGRSVPSGSGRRHLRRLLGALADLEAGSSAYDEDTRIELRVGAGTTVVVLSPLLVDAVATAAAALLRRGLPVVVVDTLPADALPDVADGADPALVDLAWRLRRVEREQVRTSLTALGCPVVAWAGPGTVDEVLRRLARRARQPRVRAR